MQARATIGFGFTTDWLKKWRETFEPITEWSNHKPKQFANYFRHLIENRSNSASSIRSCNAQGVYKMDKEVWFLTKPWCCVGGEVKNRNWVDAVNWPRQQEHKTRRVQPHCIWGTAFLQTELCLDWFSRLTRPFQLITSLAWEIITHGLLPWDSNWPLSNPNLINTNSLKNSAMCKKAGRYIDLVLGELLAQ